MDEKLFAENAADYEKLYYDNNSHIEETQKIIRVMNDRGIPVKKVLDVGCGTGLHAVELLKAGYDVKCIDSSSGMLDIARPRVEPLGGVVELADITTWPGEEEKYGCAIALFQVMSYILETDDLVKAFKVIHKSLATGGIFLCDVVSATWAYTSLEPVYYSDVKNGVMIWDRKVDETKDILEAKSTYIVGGAEKRMDTHKFRMFTGPGLALVLRAAGFSEVSYYSDSWDLAPYTKSSPNLHIVAVK